MPESTEATCLLQSGTMYPSRVGFRSSPGEDVFLGIKAGGFSLYHGDAPIYHFDFEGRWQRAFLGGVHYLKGLDAVARAVERGREGPSLVLRRRTLGGEETGDLDASIRSATLGLIEGIEAGRFEVVAPPPEARTVGPEEVRELLRRVAAWDARAWSAHREQYASIYGPWPFLPPDCPNPVVIQATVGPPFGSLDQSGARVRPPDEFRGHVRDVARLLGRRAGQSRDTFVAGGDWLRRPVADLLGSLGAIEEAFPTVPPRGDIVHAFLDDFRPPLPGHGGWRLLRASRLARVTLGIESGDPATRARYGKSWQDQALRSTVADLKAAGIGLGLIILVGAGGRPGADADSEATAGLVGSLGLGAGDLVSLVDARGLDGVGGPADPLSDDEAAGRIAALKRRLVAPGPSKGPRVVVYNPAKQWA